MSSSQPAICVQKRTRRVSRGTQQVWHRTQQVLTFKTALSKQYPIFQERQRGDLKTLGPVRKPRAAGLPGFLEGQLGPFFPSTSLVGDERTFNARLILNLFSMCLRERVLLEVSKANLGGAGEEQPSQG